MDNKLEAQSGSRNSFPNQSNPKNYRGSWQQRGTPRPPRPGFTNQQQHNNNQQMQNTRQQMQSTRPAFQPRQQSRPFRPRLTQEVVRCNYCGKIGHYDMDCRSLLVCDICNKSGHTAETCWHRTGGNGVQIQTNSTPPKRKGHGNSQNNNQLND